MVAAQIFIECQGCNNVAPAFRATDRSSLQLEYLGSTWCNFGGQGARSSSQSIFTLIFDGPISLLLTSSLLLLAPQTIKFCSWSIRAPPGIGFGGGEVFTAPPSIKTPGGRYVYLTQFYSFLLFQSLNINFRPLEPSFYPKCCNIDPSRNAQGSPSSSPSASPSASSSTPRPAPRLPNSHAIGYLDWAVDQLVRAS